MSKLKKYSQKEIQYNISVLNLRMDNLILQRKDIGKDILSIKKQIKVWEEFDENQYKMF